MGRSSFSFKTEMGKNSSTESDSFLSKDNLFIVAEGVGGDYLGEMAKETACKGTALSFFRHLSEDRTPGTALVSALKDVNEEILEERKRIGKKMAASVSVVYITGKIMYFSHLGDSRIYCLHKGEIVQLTKDHTVGEESPFVEISARDPRLLRALTDGLGIHERPDIRVKTFALREKDIILMTTEGLTRYLSNMQILKLSLKSNNLRKLSNRFIEEAKRKGARDVMTIGLIRFERYPQVLQTSVVVGSALILLILAVMGGYNVMHRPNLPVGDRPKDIQPLPEKPVERRSSAAVTPARKSAKAPEVVKEVKAEQNEGTIRQDLHAFLTEWKRAWENTAGAGDDIEKYMAFYSDDFNAQGLDKKGWRLEKAQKNKRKQWIRIELKDIKIGVRGQDNRVEVKFLQDYKSSNFSVTTGKTLILKKGNAGWKILAEKTS